MNMAIDEALLGTAREAILRFYRWDQPAVSFGYFGAVSEANIFAKGRPIVRRWTGGGIVPHGNDCTYSLIIPAGEERLKMREIYRAVHEAVARALAEKGVASSLASGNAPRLSGSCFANPVTADVMEQGQKIGGAAQRRTREGFLLQGSVQRAVIPRGFRESFARELGSIIRPLPFDFSLLPKAEMLAKEKYASTAWTCRR